MGVNVVVMGPPGAGKGTQAGRIARDRGLPRISTGDILRDGVKEKNPIALEARARMDRGELVDDATMIKIVTDRLSRPDVDAGFVLDGFPRTVAQARALDELIRQRDRGPLIVVDLAVPDEELVRRLAGRRICSDCGTNEEPQHQGDRCGKCGGRLVQRGDDDRKVVQERLRVYQQSTRPLLDYYRERPTFRAVNGAQPPAQVARELDSMIDAAASARR